MWNRNVGVKKGLIETSLTHKKKVKKWENSSKNKKNGNLSFSFLRRILSSLCKIVVSLCMPLLARTTRSVSLITRLKNRVGMVYSSYVSTAYHSQRLYNPSQILQQLYRHYFHTNGSADLRLTRIVISMGTRPLHDLRPQSCCT